MKHIVYLAGPISGLSYTEANKWRADVTKQLNNEFVECRSPMRLKDHLKTATNLSALGDDRDITTTTRGIMRRDHNDCINASVVLVNFLDTNKPSLGTAMEIAWCYDRHIPVVLVMRPGDYHEHAMIQEAVAYITDSLEEGVRLVKGLLNQ